MKQYSTFQFLSALFGTAGIVTVIVCLLDRWLLQEVEKTKKELLKNVKYKLWEEI